MEADRTTILPPIGKGLVYHESLAKALTVRPRNAEMSAGLARINSRYFPENSQTSGGDFNVISRDSYANTLGNMAFYVRWP